MDPSTFRIMFDLVNTDATSNHNLRPIGGPWSFFQRMRVLCGGVILEDLDMYHRTHELVSNFTSTKSKDNDIAEGFSNPWETAVNANSVSPVYLAGIPPNQSMTVLFKPLSGIIRQSKYLPIRYMPLTIELTLVDDPTLPIISQVTNHIPDVVNGVDRADF